MKTEAVTIEAACPEPTLLIVDDEAEVVRYIQRALAGESCRLFTAASGDEAVARLLMMIRETPVAVIVTDLMMGGMSGQELIRDALSLVPDVGVIAMTGYGDIETAVDIMKMGAVDFITKPVSIHRIRGAVRSALERWRLKQALRWSQDEIRRKNEALEKEVAARRELNEALERFNRELERRVRERTAEVLKAEVLYRNLMENASDGIFIIDGRGVILDANTRVCEIAGYAKAEFLGLKATDIVPSEDLAAAPLRFEALRRGEPILIERRWQRKDGGIIYVETSGKQIESDRFLLIVRDVTDRKATEKALIQSEARYRSFFADSHAMMLLIQPETGEIADANPAACRFYGYSLEEIRQRRIFDINVSTPEPEILEKMRCARAGESNHFIFRHRLADGAVRDVEVFSGPISIDAGIFLYSIIHDITEKRRAEAALQQNREELSAILTGLPDAVVIWDDTETIYWANQPAIDIFGAEVIGRRCSELMPECPGLLGLSCPLRRAGDVSAYNRPDFEFVRCTPDGEGRKFHLWVTATVISAHPDGRARHIMVVFRDMTGIRQLEAETMRAAQLASLGEMAAGVAHEINNPINAIINDAQLIQDDLADTETIDESSRSIVAEGRRIASIVRNLLAFSRNDGQGFVPGALGDVVRKSLALVKRQMEKDGIVLDIAIEDDLPEIPARGSELQQVFINLLGNARYALNKRFAGRDPRKRVVLRAALVADDGLPMVRATLSDQGIGIPRAVIGKIFDPFFTTKPKNEGTGLGLSISMKIVRDHGGRLSVSSEPETGTTVILDLPTWEARDGRRYPDR